MSGVWDDRIVTSSSHMPAELTAAILAGGAKAVVCAADDADPPADGAADFFRSLFSLLGNSVSLLQVCVARLVHTGYERRSPTVSELAARAAAVGLR